MTATQRAKADYEKAVKTLGRRVAAEGRALVKRNVGGEVKSRRERVIIAALSDRERTALGLMLVGDYGFSGHQIWAIA